VGTITSLLQEMRLGRSDAHNQLFAHVYDELKIIALSHIQHRNAGVLQATALVHAAYERLTENESLDAEDRRHFFYLLSRAMHDVLVEHIRSECAVKRGGRANRVPLLEVAADGCTTQVDVMDLREALAELDAVDADAARIVRARYFVGLSLEQSSQEIGCSFAVARRHWEYAKAWLHERLTRGKQR